MTKNQLTKDALKSGGTKFATQEITPPAKKRAVGAPPMDYYYMKARINVNLESAIDNMWKQNTEIAEIFRESENVESARSKMYEYLNRVEMYLLSGEDDYHALEKTTIRDAIAVLKDVFAPVNERKTGESALVALWKIAQNRIIEIKPKIESGFVLEFLHLFQAVSGRAHIYREEGAPKIQTPKYLKIHGREAGICRTQALDEAGLAIKKYFVKYPSGLENDVQSWRLDNRDRIMRYFDASEEDWKDYKWQLKHTIKEAKPLFDLIQLTPRQKRAIKKAVDNGVPFGVTPYYLSLMDRSLSLGHDHAVRAQALPPSSYVNELVEFGEEREMKLDFMGEHDTSPIDLVTRRYPHIAILKPFNTCAQICVYCQRNWEIDGCLAPDALASQKKVDEALAWFDRHKSVGEVLVTGGDPFVMNNNQLRRIIQALAEKDHIYRIRIGTRTPVVLPQRFEEGLLDILKEFHNPPKTEIAVVTHFIHSYEITPEAFEAVRKIRKLGISVYNQEVFTIENSRRFESAKLRRDLKSIGVDPYYNFNMKGKNETRDYKAPIARILQERKEEARLLPGLDRTDEPVFNLPRLGKNHLRARQDRKLIMILPDGSRMYEFHAWEKNISAAPEYIFKDCSIFKYLEKLAARGENIYEYRNIWYYY